MKALGKQGSAARAKALYFAFHSFCRVHKTLRVSPAMAAEVSDRLWSIEDIVALMDARAEPVKRPATYRKRDAI